MKIVHGNGKYFTREEDGVGSFTAWIVSIVFDESLSRDGGAGAPMLAVWPANSRVPSLVSRLGAHTKHSG